MPATPSTKLKLAFRSGGRCALIDCRIVIDTIGEAAHIHGEKEGSARYKADVVDRNCYENLIYLCPNCHTKIDKQENDYPAVLFFQIMALSQIQLSKKFTLKNPFQNF